MHRDISPQKKSLPKCIRRVPSFIQRTYSILQNPEYREFISWNTDCKGFTIHNTKGLCQEVLPHYFKHSNLHSFIRQLNMYGFGKIKRNSQTYFHPFFQKGNLNYIAKIQRRVQSKNGRNKKKKPSTKREKANFNKRNAEQKRENKNQKSQIELYIKEEQYSQLQEKDILIKRKRSQQEGKASISSVSNSQLSIDCESQGEAATRNQREAFSALSQLNRVMISQQMTNLHEIQQSTLKWGNCAEKQLRSLQESLLEATNKYISLNCKLGQKIDNICKNTPSAIETKVSIAMHGEHRI